SPGPLPEQPIVRRSCGEYLPGPVAGQVPSVRLPETLAYSTARALQQVVDAAQIRFSIGRGADLLCRAARFRERHARPVRIGPAEPCFGLELQQPRAHDRALSACEAPSACRDRVVVAAGDVVDLRE